MNDLMKYLKQITDYFKPPMVPLERLVFDCGTDFKPMKRPKGIRKRRDRQCFKNASILANETGLCYVEGFAFSEGLFPVMHAWCVNTQNEVIDPTWRDPERGTYRGVVIPQRLKLREQLKYGVYGVLDPGIVNLELIEELRQLHVETQ